MTLHNLDNLYRQSVMEHAKYPHHHAPVTEKDKHQIQKFNPTCGDMISLAVTVDDDRIIDCHFDGDGCAIAIASCSMMTDIMIGKTISQSQELMRMFSAMTMGENINFDAIGEAQILAGVTKFPTRIKCATLSWHALDDLLAHY